jgi:hypothetical protein
MTRSAALLSLPFALLLAGAPVTASPEQPRVVAVHVYNQSSMQEARVATMMAVTNRVWTRYGIVIERCSDPGAIAVILSDHPMREAAARTQAAVIGTTLFTGGHATPYINLSLGAAEAFAAGAQDGAVPFSSMPRLEREAMLDRMMGVALAHELAHYLLDTMHHTRGGLLRSGLSLRDFMQPEFARLSLTSEQRRYLLCLHETPGGR